MGKNGMVHITVNSLEIFQGAKNIVIVQHPGGHDWGRGTHHGVFVRAVHRDGWGTGQCSRISAEF